MKFIYVANVRLPTGKAHGTQIIKMCEAFARLGAEVELWAPQRYNIIKADPFDYYNVSKNFKIVKIPSLDLVRFGWLGFWIQRATFILGAIIRAVFYKADIFYSRDELFVFFSGWFNKNVFWEAHTNNFNYFVRGLVKRVFKMVVISNGLKNFFVSKGVNEKKILIAADGMSAKDFDISASKIELREKLKLPKDKFIVAYVGKGTTMGSKKGVNELILACAKLLKKYSGLFLLIVGVNKAEITKLEEIIKKEKIPKENYELVLFVPHKEMPQYLKSADALVMNYPSTEHYSLYMSPVKMFDYMASGIPIVASDLPSVREVLNQENAVLIKPDDLESLIMGIEELVQDLNKGARISSQALQDVKKYEWEKRAEKILNFIN